MYEIALSHIERIQQYSNKYLHKRLRVPCFLKVGLYTYSGNLQLPISSLVEEFKIGKVHLHMMLKDSANKIIREAYLEIKSSMKWWGIKAAQEAECSLRIKNIIGITQTNQAELGSMSIKVFFKVDPKGKSDMMSKEVRTKWKDIEPIKLSWKSLIAMETLAISFLLCSTYDLLPNAINLKL